MINQWIDGLDDLAGLDIVVARRDRGDGNGDVTSPVQNGDRWLAVLWRRLQRLGRSEDRDPDRAVVDERRTSDAGGS